MRNWDIKAKEFLDIPENYSNFLHELIKVCEKYDLSISHEDTQGSFIIEDYREENIHWLKSASILRK